MGYFSNGSEGMDYYARYCDRCIHNVPDQTCAVWMAHLIHDYAECNKADSILHILIPRGKDGENEECKMFIAK